MFIKKISFFLFFWSSISNAAGIDTLVVFGDSLSDNGNLYQYTKHCLPVSPPYYKGRFSNGKTWIESLAASLYPENPEEHLRDYAFGGAGVLKKANRFDFSLDDEIDTYLLTYQDKAQPNSLYLIWIGSNDYLMVPDNQQTTVAAVNEGIERSVSRLADMGAKHIMLMTLPDLGASPYARVFDVKQDLSSFSMAHNQALSETVSHLKTKYADVEWVLFDTYRLYLNVKTHPEAYGLSNIKRSCLVFAGAASKSVLNMTKNGRLLNNHDCSQYLFFDLLHPTKTGHDIIAREVLVSLAQTDMQF